MPFSLLLTIFFLFLDFAPFPIHNLHPAPSPRPLDMRTSACLLFQLDGGQNVGKGQRRRSKGGCRADCARQQKLPRKPGSRRDLGRDRHSRWGQQGARAPGRWEGRGQEACKALVQTLDNQLCLPWQHPVNTGVCYSHLLLCPSVLGRRSREEKGTMLRQNPSQTELFCQGAQSNKNLKHGHVGVKEETIQVGLKHMMHKMK